MIDLIDILPHRPAILSSVENMVKQNEKALSVQIYDASYYGLLIEIIDQQIKLVQDFAASDLYNELKTQP